MTATLGTFDLACPICDVEFLHIPIIYSGPHLSLPEAGSASATARVEPTVDSDYLDAHERAYHRSRDDLPVAA